VAAAVTGALTIVWDAFSDADVSARKRYRPVRGMTGRVREGCGLSFYLSVRSRA